MIIRNNNTVTAKRPGHFRPRPMEIMCLWILNHAGHSKPQYLKTKYSPGKSDYRHFRIEAAIDKMDRTDQ